METLIVVLNYRTPELTLQCLASLEDEVSGSECSVVVVDGGSGDGSAEQIARAIESNRWGGWASMSSLDENRGYAAGNNAAIRSALSKADPPRYFLILNSDIVCGRGAVAALTRFLDRNPRAGLAASQLEAVDGSAQVSAFRFPSPWSALEEGLRLGVASRVFDRWRVPISPVPDARCVDWIPGACMMIRREVFHDVGLFDEGYFLYFEEVDLCLRAARHGWQAWSVPESRMVHLGGGSTGLHIRPGDPRRRRPSYWYESRRRLILKSRGLIGLIVFDGLWALGRFTLVLRRALGLGGDTSTDPIRFSRDLLLGDLRAAFSARGRSVAELGTGPPAAASSPARARDG